MLHIVRAPRAQLGSHPALRSDDALCVPVPTQPAAWASLRALFGLLRARRAEAQIQAAVAEVAAPLSLCLRRLPLSPEQRVAREHVAGQPIGMMTHNGMLLGAVTRAWIDALGPLLEGRRVVFPDLAALEAAELMALLRLARGPVDLVVFEAIDDDLSDPIWGPERAAMGAQLLQCEATPLASSTLWQGPEAPLPREEAPRDPWDDGLEAAALAALAAGEGPARALEAAAAAFAAYGHRASLRLALAALEHAAQLSPEQAFQAHVLVALSAYNRQVRSLGNEVLAALLQRHFAAAYALAPDPVWRCRLLYRLAINAGRRQGDLDEAMALADQGVALAQRLPDGVGPWLEAWSRNGRAYLLARRRALGPAIADVEAALALLERAKGAEGVPAAELAPTEIVLLDNLSELATRAGDVEAALGWQRRLEERVDPVLARGTASRRWIDLHLARLELGLAERYAQRGLASAVADLDPIDEEFFRSALGELRYRRGDAAGAADHFRAALALRVQLALPDSVRLAQVSLALAAARAGDRGEAGAQLAAAREAAEVPAEQAEIAAQLGLLSAQAGESAAAEAWINEAIALAVQVGARDTLVRVAVAASRASAALGRTEEARAAASQARALAAGAPLPGVDRLAVALLDPPDPGALEEVLPELEATLRDPEAWWLLPALVAAFAGVEPRRPDVARGLALAQRALAARALGLP